MYQQFTDRYPEQHRISDGIDEQLVDKIAAYSKGFREFAESLSGSSFGGGIYRTHAIADILKWSHIVHEAFPVYAGKVIVFGYDWLGRHFALDQRRVKDDDMEILLIEPGVGEAMEIPVGINEFHNVELVEYAADALAEPFFQNWKKSYPEELKHSECVGYKVPLFLNGNDDLDNLEVTDMDVYWTLSGQLLSQIQGGQQGG